uniref:Uncharacterized protein n=1 Tax=Oryza punctata TaxID=4537 RepID=A0A0E0M5N8_ORYPU
MIGDLIPKEYGILLVFQVDGRGIRLHTRELPLHADSTRETRKRAVAKGVSSSRTKIVRSSRTATPATNEEYEAEDSEEADAESEAKADDEAGDDVGDNELDTDTTVPTGGNRGESPSYTPSPGTMVLLKDGIATDASLHR